jgi:hypothetical protein
MAAAGEQTHGRTVPLHDEPITVVLDLVHHRPLANESMPQSLARPAEPVLIQINRQPL